MRDHTTYLWTLLTYLLLKPAVGCPPLHKHSSIGMEWKKEGNDGSAIHSCIHPDQTQMVVLSEILVGQGTYMATSMQWWYSDNRAF